MRMIASACEKFLRAWHNEDFYEFNTNGEAFALDKFAGWIDGRQASLWDVGAHRGSWALTAAQRLPNAVIHSFEIVPATADHLVEQVKGFENIRVHRSGLSDQVGELEVIWNESYDTTSSISPMLGSKYYGSSGNKVRVDVTTVDALVETMPPPSLMKIDVEGHELSVLAGAQKTLSRADGPAMLQIEYGVTYIPTGSTLKRLYDLVSPFGYSIGRLFPGHVEFKKYEFSDDNFRMGNFIAVRDSKLRDALS